MKEAIDQEAVADMKALMKGKFRELVSRYCANGEEYIAKLKAALTAEDFDALASNAHALKSPSALLGLCRVSSLAEEIEVLAKNKGADGLEDIQRLVGDLGGAYGEASRFLTEELESLEG